MTYAIEQMSNGRHPLTEALNTYIGPGRLMPTRTYGERTGTAEGTVHSWLRGETLPSIPNLYPLMDLLPAGFTEMGILNPVRMFGATKLSESNACPKQALTTLLANAHMIATHLEDDNVTPQEKAEQRQRLLKMLPQIASYVATL